MTKRVWWIGLLLCFVLGCEPPKVEPPPPPPPPPPPVVIEATPGNAVMFITDGKWDTEKTFFDFPYPSDLRLTAKGGPDFKGFPNPVGNKLVDNVLANVSARKGFPVVPVGYFRFPEAVAKSDLDKAIVGSKDASVFLIDIDPTSPARGKMFPVAVGTQGAGIYVKDHLLTVGVYPGVVLPPERLYAFVLMRSFNDAAGKPLGVPKALNELKAAKAPAGDLGEKLKALYAPLWETLKKAEIKVDDVAAATVFTTGDVVADTARISNTLLETYKPEIKNLKLDPDDGDHERYCELLGTIVQPQFQKGTPPFDTDGLFVFDEVGNPQKQRDEEIPVVITIPKKPMPEEGYPLLVYVHGSGGSLFEVVDRGVQTEAGGPKKKGEGPAHVVAAFGIAAAGSAMPVNPERLKNANDFAYLNLINPSAMRDTFRQGVIENRLFLDALLRLKIPKEALGACTGATLPAGKDHFFFSEKRPALMGQSMGGMYTNMISAVEPRYRAIVPTGAGGYWSFFALNSNVSLLNEKLLRRLLEAEEVLTYTHPVMQLLQTVWEPAEPLVHVPRISHRPFPGVAPRQIYQPIGANDSYFPEVILDILSLGYGNQQAGKEFWKGTQERLAAQKLDGLAEYPIKNNRSPDGAKDTNYTGVVVQYEPYDVSKNGHMIAFQLDEVKYQYGCFLDTHFRTGTAVVPAPKPLGTPCPE